jgi:hypothetical protein
LAEGGGKIITHTIVEEALAFPVKIVMMRNDGVARLGDELGDCQTERQVDGNGNRILDDQRFEAESLGELVKMLFKEILQFLYLPRDS